MAKGTGENQDYYRHAGQSVGRGTYADERGKLSQSRRKQRPEAGLPRAKPAVKSTGASTQTVARLKKERAQREERKVEHDEVERMVDAQVPSPPPARLLPAASLGMMWQDFRREIIEDWRGTRRASRELYSTLNRLIRAPARLLILARRWGWSKA